MTKKKLVAVIMAISFIFFCGASYLNFSAAKQYASKEYEAMYHHTIAEARDVMALFDEREEKDFEYFQESLRSRCVLFRSDFAENRAYAYVVADRQGNVVFESESGVWFFLEGDTKYMSLEKYMTPEIKKDIMDFKKKSDGNMLLMSKLNLNFTDGVYEPVSFELTDNRFDPDEEKNESLTVWLSDLKITHTVDEYMTCELYNLQNDKEYNEVNAKLKEELKTFDYSWNARLSLTDFISEVVQIIETVGDYHFIGFVKCDLTKTALSSDFFYNQMITTVFGYIVLTAASLLIAMSVLKRSDSSHKKAKEE